MSGPTEEEIRTKAYQLWRFVGEPACKMDRFWNKPRILKELSELGDNLPL